MGRKIIDDIKRKAGAKRISGDVKKYCLSGDGTHELIDLEQTMANVISYTEGLLHDAQKAVEVFETRGGSVTMNHTENGTEAVFTYRSMIWTHRFNESGRCIGCNSHISDIDDLRPLEELSAAIRAYYSMDKLELTIEEMRKILAYLENDNALRGMDNIAAAVKENASLLVDMASSTDTDDGDAQVDFGALLRGV